MQLAVVLPGKMAVENVVCSKIGCENAAGRRTGSQSGIKSGNKMWLAVKQALEKGSCKPWNDLMTNNDQTTNELSNYSIKLSVEIAPPSRNASSINWLMSFCSTSECIM